MKVNSSVTVEDGTTSWAVWSRNKGKLKAFTVLHQGSEA
jgi:hypothetical protein